MKLLAILCLVLSACLVQPAAAQTEPPDAPAQSPDRLSSLIEVLKDDEARQALIGELEQAAEASGSTDPQAAEQDAEQRPSLGRRVAAMTTETAQVAAQKLSLLWGGLSRSPDVFDGLNGDELSVLVVALQQLVLVIFLTIAVYLLLRRLFIPVYRRMGRRAQGMGAVGTVLLALGSAAIDVAIVVAAWAIGYAVTVTAIGTFGEIGIRQSLYLNAFLLVELIKVALRAVLSPSSGGLRILPLDDAGARRTNFYVNIVVSVLGYGQLLVVPIVNQSVSYAAGQSVSAMISVLALIYLFFLVVHHRHPVADWMLTRLAPPIPPAPAQAEVPEAVLADAEAGVAAERAYAEDEADRVPPLSDEERAEATDPEKRGMLAVLARNWHWIMLPYLTVMFAIVMTSPQRVVTGALIGSAKIILALVLAALVSGALVRMMARGVHLPQRVNERLPLLQPRLNRVLPRVLFLARYAILVAVVLFALDTVHALDIGAWLETDLGLRLTGTVTNVVLILAVAYLGWLGMTSWVDYRLNPGPARAASSREQTLLSLFRNAATIALLVLTLMIVLSELGLNIGPLLASAGVLGLAIGFGAQKMVQDVITGVFIQLENAINVGDVVTVGGTTGVVEKLTIRSVSLRDVQGVYHVIPFSSVDMVSNFMREFSYFVCDMGVAYREDIDEVKQAMFDGFAELRRDPEQKPFLLDDLEWFGLNSFGDSAVVVRARIKTVPGKQWGVGRAYNGILKRIFDERGIEIPFPHQTIFLGEAKDGSTQPFRVLNGQGQQAQDPT